MANPAILGVGNAPLTTGAVSNPASITVPAEANAFVMVGTYYDGGNQPITSLASAAFADVVLDAISSTDNMSGYLAFGRVVASGAQTLVLTKSGGSYTEGPTGQIVWLNVADPTNFVRERKLNAGNTGPLTQSVASSLNDLVLAFVGGDGGFTPGSMTGYTLLGSRHVNNTDGSEVYSANAPGASSTSCTGPVNGYATQALISIFNAEVVPSGPTVTLQPANTSVAAGATATFTSTATGAGALAGQWQTNNGSGWTNVSGETGDTYSRVTSAADNGLLVRRLYTDDNGSTASSAATLTVIGPPDAFDPGAFDGGAFVTEEGGEPPVTPSTSRAKFYSGGTWVSGVAKRHNGGAWVAVSVKRNNGTSWN